MQTPQNTLQKAYNVKIYTLAGTFVVAFPKTVIMDAPAFTSQIAGGQGELSMRLNLPFISAALAYNNIIKVYEADDAHPNARLIYTGVVGSLRRMLTKSGEYIEVRAVGIASLFSWIYFKSGANYSFTLNQDSALTMKAVADYMSTIYPGLVSYTGTSVETVGSSSSLAFAYTKGIDAFKMASEATLNWWHIGADGVLQFHPKTGALGQLTHKVTVGKDVDLIELEENVERVVNKYILGYTGGGPYIAQDATSQAANGLRELYENKTEIQNSGTATTAGDAFIAQNKNIKKKTIVTVNSLYDIETIRPGDLIQVQNFEYSISGLQIVKIDYNPDNIKLELEESNSFTKEIFNP